MDGARSPAPDLFTALAWGTRLAPEHPADPDANAERPTVPELPVLGGPSPRVRESAVVVDAALAAVTVSRDEAVKAGFSPLADLLEPDSIASEPLVAEEFDDLLEVFDEVAAGVAPAKPTIDLPPTSVPPRPLPHRSAPSSIAPPAVAFPRPGGGATVPVVERRPAGAPMFPAPGDPADSAQLATASLSASVPMVSRVAPLVDVDLDDPPRSGGHAWAWITLSLMLAGALGWVLYTQTDLFSGDVIGNRNAEALAQAESELADKKAAIEAKQAEYGTIQIDSTPEGARVLDVRPGPEARYDALPIAHEYMVVVTAPGHVPRVRTVKGSELSAPVVVDLDPLPAGAAAPPLPEAPPPRLADAPGKDTATLVLRSNTKDARLALLVGYTPGARLLDVDVEQPRTLWIALAGHELHELVVKGRHYEDGPDGVPAYAETVTLVPAKPVADVEDEEIEVGEADPAAATAAVPPGPAAAVAPAPAPVKAPANKKKKKKKKRRR
jgi:hypothetical protein